MAPRKRSPRASASSMSDEERQALQETAASMLVMRDLLIQLLAYEASRHPDQRQFFEGLAKMPTRRVAAGTKGSPLDVTTVSFQETVLGELDYILGNARHIATGKG